MSKLLSVALCLLLATPSLAADWKYEGGNVPIAYFDNGEAQFQFACRGGDLAMAYWVRKPSPDVAAATSLSLAINASGTPSGSLASTGGTIFAQDFPLIHSDGSSILVRGPVARQWARIAQRAGDMIRVGFVRRKAQGGLEVFDGHEFGARGSNAAIAKVLGQCG
ncbi:hypothetical protein JP75_22645 [Devosia riboflavina]|uniref:Uncharacterized protein n=1 Tax=Devosia riboflavina TaxID=46914 RepID=A0A087LX27_9HYPH|nr:hypothetical protein [Devosia riboflavina]KFL29180.1 hypothetical protein JP75_22645 [Devosia riboflavina]